MTTIPASSLVPGDRVVRCEQEPGLAGWSVAEAEGIPFDGYVGLYDPPKPETFRVVLLSLGRFKETKYGPHSDDVNVDTETRTAYLKADTMLDVERSSE